MHAIPDTEQIIRLKEISARLKTFNCDQSSLVLIEILFLEVLAILRTINYKEVNILNNLLAVKANEYVLAQQYYRSVKTKEKAIRQFRFYFKRALDKLLYKDLLHIHHIPK